MKLCTLWQIERGATRVFVFGAGPSSRDWSSPGLERLVAESESFWNETPELGSGDRPLVQAYGIDPEKPLPSWLSLSEMSRVESAAAELKIDGQTLVRLRPWLAAQVIKLANDARAGFKAELSPETRLLSVARTHGVPVHSEFGTPDMLLRTFSSWPPDVEVQRLMSTVVDVELGPERLRRYGEAWHTGNLDELEAVDRAMRSDYPALYEHLIVHRNQAWVRRIDALLSGRNSAVIVVGTGHLVGLEGLPSLLDGAGFSPRRVSEAPG